MGLLTRWRKAMSEPGLLMYAGAWLVLFGLVLLAYKAGTLLAPYIGWATEPSIFGLLTAITSISTYVYFQFADRCDRLSENMDRGNEALSERIDRVYTQLPQQP